MSTPTNNRMDGFLAGVLVALICLLILGFTWMVARGQLATELRYQCEHFQHIDVKEFGDKATYFFYCNREPVKKDKE